MNIGETNIQKAAVGKILACLSRVHIVLRPCFICTRLCSEACGPSMVLRLSLSPLLPLLLPHNTPRWFLPFDTDSRQSYRCKTGRWSSRAPLRPCSCVASLGVDTAIDNYRPDPELRLGQSSTWHTVYATVIAPAFACAAVFPSQFIEKENKRSTYQWSEIRAWCPRSSHPREQPHTKHQWCGARFS